MFQISVDYEIYRQYHIWFWGIRYNVNFIIVTDIGVDMTDIYGHYWCIDAKIHWPVLTPRF